jgi:hypothetical protein
MAWKKNCRKNYKNHLRINNHEICTAVALCFPNVLDVMVLQNVNLSEDKIERPPLWSNDTDVGFCHQSVIYAVSSVYFKRTLISYAVFHFSEKITCFAFYLVLWTEFTTYQSTNLRRSLLDLFCNYYHIQCMCVIILQHLWSFCSCNLSFCHILARLCTPILWCVFPIGLMRLITVRYFCPFIVNLDIIPLNKSVCIQVRM